MFTVLIDTSAFEKEGLSFSGAKFEALEKFSADEKIKIVHSSITLSEINRHIEDSLTKFADSFKRVFDKEADHIAKTDLSIVGMSRASLKDVKDKLINHRLNKVKDFFESVQTVELVYDGIKVQQLVTDYLSKNPPFSTKKPFEFPDAIVLSALLAQFEESLDKLCVVSSDADFKNFCHQHEQIKFFNEISEFTDFINSSFDAEFSRELRGAIDNELISIAHSMEQSIYNDAEFVFNDDFYSPEAEIEKDSVAVKILEVRLISSDTVSAMWELDLHITYNVVVTDQNLDSMVKDYDTKEWIVWETLSYLVHVDKYNSIQVSSIFNRFDIESSFEYSTNFDLPDAIYDLDGEDFQSLESVEGPD
jgi:hypothetical protein